jgi:hypothetical protein
VLKRLGEKISGCQDDERRLTKPRRTVLARCYYAIFLEGQPCERVFVDRLGLRRLLALVLRDVAKIQRLTNTGGSIAVRARGSTGCTTSSSSSALPDVRLEFDRMRPAELSVRVRWMLADAMLFRGRSEAARGRCSIPTLKSHSNNRVSSPTLPIR